MIEIPRSSRADAVANSIEEQIATQGLPPGHRLGTKESLRREYDVAVATFNEAVRLLSARGTVAVRPGVNGGIFVASPTALVRLGRKMLELSGESVSVADCLMMRDALDPLVVREATRHRNAQDVRELRKIVRQMTAVDLAIAEYLRINWALHRRMAEITPNQILRHTYLSLLAFVESRLQGVTADEPARGSTDGPQVHEELVEAIASGDVERADRAASRHTTLTAS
ncbi:FadR/GntR family transcriptional regulator [Micromonospora sp. NPDC005163]